MSANKRGVISLLAALLTGKAGIFPPLTLVLQILLQSFVLSGLGVACLSLGMAGGVVALVALHIFAACVGFYWMAARSFGRAMGLRGSTPVQEAVDSGTAAVLVNVVGSALVFTVIAFLLSVNIGAFLGLAALSTFAGTVIDVLFVVGTVNRQRKDDGVKKDDAAKKN